MSYQYHGTTDLIALPNRTVQTYPSGLVRVERSFVCRKDQVAKYRNTIKVNEPMPFDDGAPAIDGLYIFPEPQEVVRDDGFVEFRVTAYGRTNTVGSYAVNKVGSAINFSIFQSSSPGASLVSANTQKSVLANSYIIKIVFSQNEQIDIDSIRKKYEAAIFDFSGNLFTETNAYQLFPYLASENYFRLLPDFTYTREAPIIEIESTLRLASFESAAFGEFQETTMVFDSVSTKSFYQLGSWYKLT